jgi:hypothetical protein
LAPLAALVLVGAALLLGAAAYLRAASIVFFFQ